MQALGFRLCFPPALERAGDAGCCCDLDDFTRDEWSDGEGPCRGGAVMSVVGKPTGAEKEDGKGCGNGRNEGAAETRGKGLHDADDPACDCGGERVREEEAAVGAEQMGDASGCVGGEDRKADGAFDEVENHRRKAGDRAESHPDEENCEVLQSERHGREGKGKRDVGAGGHERCRTNNEERFVGEGFQKRSGAAREAELRGNGRLHKADSFRARSAWVK